MKNLQQNLQNKYGNYLYPFFWQHGESEELLRKYTEKVHAVCVLKDSRTLVKAPEGRLMINTTGNAAMAKA